MNLELNRKLYPESDPRRKKLIGHVAKDIMNKLNLLLEEGNDYTPGPELYTKTLSQLNEKLKTFLPDNIEEVDSIIQTVVNSDYIDYESFSSSAAEILVDYILKHFDYEQIELLSRRERNMLNRLVEYEIDNDVVRLHIPLTLLDNGVELRTLFIGALKELAKRFNEDSVLQTVKRIDASSWMIYRIPDKYLEKIGFSNIERYEKDQTGSAEMSREVLLEKYGQD